jgi:hypothetical protein
MGFIFGISGLSFGMLGFIFGISASNSATSAASKVNKLEQRLSDAGILDREHPTE